MESYKAEYRDAVKSCDQQKMYDISRSAILSLMDGLDLDISKFNEWCKFTNQHSCSKQRKRVSDYIWLTINLRPEHNLNPSDFVSKIERLCKQSKISEYDFVIEQRGKEVYDLKSLHTHILLRRSSTAMPAHIKQSAKIIFKDYCDVQNSSILNFHQCPEEFVEDKRIYIGGDKNGPDKERRIATDKCMRKEFQLYDIYSSKGNKYLV